MEPQARCKGCRNYLTVPPGQPCSVCDTVNTTHKKANRRIGRQILQYINNYANQLTSNNHHNTEYGPQPAYTGYHAPHVYDSGYYSPPPLTPPPQAVSPASLYDPSTYATSGYGSGYYNQYQRPVHEPIYNQYYQRPVHAPKRAVLCGVTYKGQKQTLSASVTNVRSMHQLLLEFGYPNASIRILTEEESDPTRIPTRRNIRMALEWLTKDSRSGDSLVFYYAGHGSHVRDANGDEKDGLDEALCPVDYRVSGKILDDEVNNILVAPLPHGVILHSVMDTCFSGTLLDLPFLCRIDQEGFYKWENQYLSDVSQYGGTSGGKAICISACDDHQNSADTSAFTGNAIGALTYSFIQTVESGYKLTYGDLLDKMRKIVHEAQQQQGLNAQFASSKAQEPQLSSSTRFEIYSKPFIL